MNVTIPPGAAAGQQFHCQIPLAQPPPAAAQAYAAPPPVQPQPQPQVVMAEAAPSPAVNRSVELPPATNPELAAAPLPSPAPAPMPAPTVPAAAPPLEASVVHAVPSPAPAPSPTMLHVQPPLGAGVGGGASVVGTREMSGWLEKMGEVRKAWKKRWFALRGGELVYGDSETSKTSGSIALNTMEGVVPLVDETAPGAPPLFHIVTATRTYILKAQNTMELTSWVEALRDASMAARGAGAAAVEVSPMAPRIKSDGKGGSFVSFEFALSFYGQQLATISGRYSELRAHHDTLCLDAPRGVQLQRHFGTALEFPPKTSWLTDDTQPVMIAERAAALCKYYVRLFCEDEGGLVLQNALLAQLLSLPPAAVEQLKVVGAGRQQARQQVIPPLSSLFTLLRPYLAHFFPVFSRFLRIFTVLTRRFQRAPSRNPGPRNGGTRTKTRDLGPSFDAPDAYQRINWQAAAAAAQAEAAAHAALLADQQLAQNVQSQPCQPGLAAPLVYAKLMHFTLKNKIFSFGDATIKGPGELPFFKVLRVDGILLSGLLRNCQFSLGTLANQPLLFLQEEFEMFTYRYSIYRTTPTGEQMLVASIVRKIMASMLSLTDQYDIQLPSSPGHAVTCTGSWPNNFVLQQSGPSGVFAAATVTKKVLAWSDTYDVAVAPGMDVLLYLGIATAIDRIHHEVEERHRRN